jgi:DNA-binding winged helix-turn-helix (wHTH) protein/tetratricopeptide (TPR) repeat protein
MKLFEPFRLDAVNHCLWRAGERVFLTPKAFDVLRYLVDHADRLVSQAELLEAVWPETYVNPEGVRKYIQEIRKVLGDRPDQSVFIQTLPKRGYQFVAPVTEGRYAAAPSETADALANTVGRGETLAELDGHLKKSLNGQRQIVFVTGEAGIGKSTLLDAFQQRAAGYPTLRIARGQCIEGFGGKESYYPMLEALGGLLQGEEESALVQLLAKRAPTWLIQFPSLVKAEQRESLKQEIQGTTRERMVREICEAVEAITAQTPLVLILEDLHWADASTLDLLSAFARRREPAKLLLLGSFRPTDVILSQSPLKALKQDLLVRHLCHEITVERLEESDVAEYLIKMFPDSGLPPALANLLHRHCGGNALFMAALVQDLVKKGLVAQLGGTWVLTAPLEDIDPGVPDTLQQMLDIQIEQLCAEEQRVLEGASVAGERFSIWAVAAMLDVSADEIEAAYERLAGRHQFIRFAGIQTAADGSHSAHYEFRHALYRQALYRRLSSVNRSKLHRSLGERLKAICSAGRQELASEVAVHFEGGRDYEQAARFLMLAAENAQKRFSDRDSIQVLRQALELISENGLTSGIELKIQIYRRIGDAEFALGEMSSSVESYETAANLAAKADRRAEQVGVLMQMALPVFFIEQARGEQIRGEQVLKRALQVSRTLADPLLLAQTELSSACFRLLYDSWRAEELETCVRAEKTIRGLAGPSAPVHMYHIYVQALMGHGREALQAADAMITKATDRTVYVGALGAMGLSLMSLGRFGEMLQIIRRERELGRKNESGAWMWILGEAWLRLLCCDFAGVRRVAEITMSSDVEAHAIWSRTAARIATGYQEIGKGNHKKAVELFAQVRNYDITPKFFLHWHWRMHAELGATEARLSAGDIQNARREADGFLESALSVADPNLRAFAWEINSRVARAEGNGGTARAHIQNALAVADQFQIPISGWQVHRTAGDLCEDEGDRASASQHRTRAQELIMKVADSFDPGEPLRASFLAIPQIYRLREQAASA